MQKITNYKGHSITESKIGITVEYQGDELYFRSMTEAKDFVDGIK